LLRRHAARKCPCSTRRRRCPIRAREGNERRPTSLFASFSCQWIFPRVH
jgi:hypothetical protein